MKRVLLCFLLFLAGCGPSKPSFGSFSIGRDISWFPLHFGQMGVNINGFTNALVQELSKVEDKNFQIADVAWNQLFDGLQRGDYAGVFTSLPPNIMATEMYDFSDPYLLLGPVLVVPTASNATSLADLKNSIVGAYQYDDSVLIVQKYPTIIIELYQTVNQAFEDLIDGKIGGALIPVLEAKALIPNLYTDQLKIVTPPLNDKGLRVITLKGKHSELIKSFNQGLKKLKKEGTYQKIRNKYGVK